MNILLIGKNGQIGYELCRSLLPLGHLITLGRDDLDLENAQELEKLLNQYSPHIIVNAAAYTAVDQAETNKQKAFAINANAVHILAHYAYQKNALLVHYSTDYVFDGEKKTAYVETDPTRPLNAYGRSKKAGEDAIFLSGCAHLIFRTSWVFSERNTNFIKTILRLAQKKTELKVINDQFGTPTSAALIADVTAIAILSYFQNAISNGLYHLTASGFTNWYQYSLQIVNRALENGASLSLRPQHVLPISSEQYTAPAIRPKNSQLNCDLLARKLSLQIPDWSIYVNRLIDNMTSAKIILFDQE